jgi:hypothetical protein
MCAMTIEFFRGGSTAGVYGERTFEYGAVEQRVQLEER